MNQVYELSLQLVRRTLKKGATRTVTRLALWDRSNEEKQKKHGLNVEDDPLQPPVAQMSQRSVKAAERRGTNQPG